MRILWVVGLLSFVLFPLGLWGQGTSGNNPNIQVSDAAALPPSSSVDLLQEAVKKENPFAPSTAGKAPKVPTAPAKPVSTSTVSTSTVAVPAVPKQANVSVNVKASNTLDMPLSVGGKTTSVQTTVAPAKTVSTNKPAKPVVTTTPSTTTATDPAVENTEEEDAADAELEYAVKMLEKSKEEAQAGRSIPPSAAKNKPSKVPAANKAFNPNAFRPGVEWIPSKSTHFAIYTQKPNGTIGSANMAMTFETAYDTLRRFIPWMMAGQTKAFVYQDHNSYLRFEPEAKAWTRAIAYPTRGEIAVYDEPGKMQELKEVFAHELTHIFTQQFFDKHQTGRIMTPTWLDEGLAVLVEDQMFASPKLSI